MSEESQSYGAKTILELGAGDGGGGSDYREHHGIVSLDNFLVPLF